MLIGSPNSSALMRITMNPSVSALYSSIMKNKRQSFGLFPIAEETSSETSLNSVEVPRRWSWLKLTMKSMIHILKKVNPMMQHVPTKKKSKPEVDPAVPAMRGNKKYSTNPDVSRIRKYSRKDTFNPLECNCIKPMTMLPRLPTFTVISACFLPVSMDISSTRLFLMDCKEGPSILTRPRCALPTCLYDSLFCAS